MVQTFIFSRLIRIALIVFSFSSFISCTKDENTTGECADRNLGPYYLITSPDNFIPYQGKTLLKFVDSLGNNLTLLFNPDIYGYIEYQRDYNAYCGDNYTTEHKWTVDLNKYDYDIKEIDSTLSYYWKLTLYKSAQPNKLGDIEYPTEYFGIKTVYKNQNYDGPAINWTVAVNDSILPLPLTQNPEYQYFSNITLLGKSFNDVYMHWDSMLYYSFEEGIIAFKDPYNPTNHLWVLDEKNVIP